MPESILPILLNGGAVIVAIYMITKLIKVLKNGISENLHKMVESLNKMEVSHVKQEGFLESIKDSVYESKEANITVANKIQKLTERMEFAIGRQITLDDLKDRQ